MSIQTQQYLPDRDQPLNAWAVNFYTKINATPTAYGLTAGQATAFGVVQAAFTAALLLATQTSTRTKSTVAAKNATKAAMLVQARALANIVQEYPSTTNQQRQDLMLTVRNTVPSVIAEPTSAPIVTLLNSAGGRVNFRFADTLTPSSRAKPPGVTAMNLYVSTSDTAPTNISQMTFAGQFTKNTSGAGSAAVNVNFDPTDYGKTAYFIGVWTNRKGQTGPQSARSQMIVAA